jgi:hypothetical protein
MSKVLSSDQADRGIQMKAESFADPIPPDSQTAKPVKRPLRGGVGDDVFWSWAMPRGFDSHEH